MGKASRAKHERLINQAANFGSTQGPTKGLHEARGPVFPFAPLDNGAAFNVFVNSVCSSGHQMAFSCLENDNYLFLNQLEEGAATLGKSCLDLVFVHPANGLAVNIFSLAVGLKAEHCLAVLSMIAGRLGRFDMVSMHLDHLFSCFGLAGCGDIPAFARATLKNHFARSRKRGSQNVAALVQHAQAAGCGSAASILIGEIEAEELADFERRELEVLLAPRANTRSAAKAL